MVAIPPGQAPGTSRTLHAGDGAGGVIRRTILPGGLRVVTEQMPQVRSASLGVWAQVGSRDEAESLAGASHFLEHLLFKGTERRSAMEISAAIDGVGGESNAFTTKEYTCYFARVLDTDLPLAIDVVCDLVTSASLRSADVESEREVILDEIAMHEDDPADAVHDVFAARLWGDTPLGRPVIGTTDSISALTRQQIAGYYRRRYRRPALVVAVAGNVEHDVVVGLIERAFAGEVAGGTDAAEPMPPRGSAGGASASGAGAGKGVGKGVGLTNRPTEQANLVLGMPGLARTDERRFALGVLNAAFGGGMSSRLFQRIREERGLTYSVYSFSANYADAGMVGIYAGCLPKKVDEVLALCVSEIAEVAERGLTEDELVRGKGQLRGSLVLGMEDTMSRMGRLAKAELVYGELLTIDEILARIDAVTLDNAHAVAKDLYTAPQALAVVGPFEDPDRFASALHLG